jgi:HTH-type transcriptional regulator/antitoxin MqsA
MNRKPRFCLNCDDGTVLELAVKEVIVNAAQVTKIAPEIAGWHCPQCGEIEFIDEESSARYQAVLESAWAEARADASRSIRAIRKKLGLKQAEAGRLFGGGVNAFSLYEHGKTTPHKSTLLLLNLLDRHPELLRELA